MSPPTFLLSEGGTFLYVPDLLIVVMISTGSPNKLNNQQLQTEC